MAKQRLYENITLTKAQAIKQSRSLSDADRQEIAESVASHMANGGKVTKELKEKANSIIRENIGKNKWRLPISRFDFINQNRRRYSKDLWEKVINNQRDIWEGCVGLADHPAQGADPSFKDSAVIWNNLSLDETNKLVWADAIFVGEMGRLAEDILESGGKVGLSTAGLGDLEKVTEHVDGNYMEFYDVIPDEFIIERVADLVPNPSQDVFGFGDMKVSEAAIDAGAAQKLNPADDKRQPATAEEHPPLEGEEADLPEDPHAGYDAPDEAADPRVVWVSGDTSLREAGDGGGDAGAAGTAVAGGGVDSQGAYAEAPENVTTVTEPGRRRRDYKDTGSEGKTMEPRTKPTLTSFEQRRAYDDITRFIDSASQLSSPHERLSEFKEIQTYLQDVDIPELKEEIQTKIEATEEEINKLVESGKEFKEIFGTDISAADLKGALKNLSSVRNNLKESSYDWKKVAVKTAEHLKKFVEAVQILKNRPTIETHENLKKRNKQIQESLRAQMKDSRQKRDKRIKELEGDLTKAHDALRRYIKESKQRESQLREALAQEKQRSKKIKEQAQKLKENASHYVESTMGEEVRYLVEGAKGAGNRAEEHRRQSRSITETANSKRISESKREVQEYFDSLLKKHGSAILPYSQEILEASNYQEAVNRYMRILDSRTHVSADTLLDMENPMIYEAMMAGE